MKISQASGLKVLRNRSDRLLGCRYARLKLGVHIKLKGFSLIELLVVVAIISILTAIISIKYLNLSSDATQAAVDGLTGALNSGARLNYYKRTINPLAGIPLSNCKDAASLLQEGLPSNYKINSKKVANNTVVQCTLTGPDKLKGKFYVRGIH